MKLHVYPPWAMLAWDYYDLKSFDEPRPMIIQPKLNGVRAIWHHIEKKFISRDGKVFPEHVIPHLYEQARRCQLPWSLDGELYNHRLPFQTIAGMVSPNRVEAAKDIETICFVVFDIISTEITVANRFKTLALVPFNRLAFHLVELANTATINTELDNHLLAKYEGIMLREPDSVYTVGRTRNLIKVKRLQHRLVIITDIIEGTGKFRGKLGALKVVLRDVAHSDIHFKIGGGKISTEDRAHIWQRRKDLIGHIVTIGFSETSAEGKPLKAQLINRNEFYKD